VRRLTAFTLALALALGVAAALALASCGGGENAKLLPGISAQEISENLDLVKQLVNEGECVGATNAAQEVSAQVEGLTGVDAKLKQALQSGAARLGEVVATCEESATEAVSPANEAPSTEEELPPGLEKKAEKEREKEEKGLEKEASKQEKETPAPTETTPTEPPATTPAPPAEGGGTGAPGGVGPGAPVGEGE
jgi:septal ring-binding cell division protein DamX